MCLVHSFVHAQLCLSIYDPMEFSRQEYSSGLPLPPPGDLLNPGNDLASLALASLAGRFFTAEPPFYT